MASQQQLAPVPAETTPAASPLSAVGQIEQSLKALAQLPPVTTITSPLQPVAPVTSRPTELSSSPRQPPAGFSRQASNSSSEEAAFFDSMEQPPPAAAAHPASTSASLRSSSDEGQFKAPLVASSMPTSVLGSAEHKPNVMQASNSNRPPVAAAVVNTPSLQSSVQVQEQHQQRPSGDEAEVQHTFVKPKSWYSQLDSIDGEEGARPVEGKQRRAAQDPDTDNTSDDYLQPQPLPPTSVAAAPIPTSSLHDNVPGVRSSVNSLPIGAPQHQSASLKSAMKQPQVKPVIHNQPIAAATQGNRPEPPPTSHAVHMPPVAARAVRPGPVQVQTQPGKTVRAPYQPYHARGSSREEKHEERNEDDEVNSHQEGSSEPRKKEEKGQSDKDSKNSEHQSKPFSYYPHSQVSGDWPDEAEDEILNEWEEFSTMGNEVGPGGFTDADGAHPAQLLYNEEQVREAIQEQKFKEVFGLSQREWKAEVELRKRTPGFDSYLIGDNFLNKMNKKGQLDSVVLTGIPQRWKSDGQTSLMVKAALKAKPVTQNSYDDPLTSAFTGSFKRIQFKVANDPPPSHRTPMSHKPNANSTAFSSTTASASKYGGDSSTSYFDTASTNTTAKSSKGSSKMSKPNLPVNRPLGRRDRAALHNHFKKQQQQLWALQQQGLTPQQIMQLEEEGAIPASLGGIQSALLNTHSGHSTNRAYAQHIPTLDQDRFYQRYNSDLAHHPATRIPFSALNGGGGNYGGRSAQLPTSNSGPLGHPMAARPWEGQGGDFGGEYPYPVSDNYEENLGGHDNYDEIEDESMTTRSRQHRPSRPTRRPLTQSHLRNHNNISNNVGRGRGHKGVLT